MQRLNGIDSMFVYSETAKTPMEVAYACIFDPTTAPNGYSFEAVRNLLEERVPTLVPFRRRLIAVPLGLDHPRWVDDPDFNLDNHLHRSALPSPGGEAELTRMVAQVMGRPLDANQPPWEMHVIEGLQGGRVGLIAKVHHAVIDGVAGAQLMAQLLDVTAQGRPVTEFCPPWLPAALPSNADMVTDALPNLFTSPIRTVRALREIGRTAFRLARNALDDQSGPVSIPVGAPPTFETPVGPNRAVSFAQLSLGQVLQLKERFGVTVNDVVLTICSGALRSHLAERHHETDQPLVAVVPVSVRSGLEGEVLGNQLSAMFVPLANDRESPLDRLAAIVESCSANKAQERAVGYGPMASAISDAVPPALARTVLQLGAQFGALRRLRAGNLMISNVPGPTFPLFFAGMQMEAVHPLGPVVDGVALNITVQSYMETLFVGINACEAAVPDLPALAQAMVRELGFLCDAAEAAGPTGRADQVLPKGKVDVKPSVPRGVSPTPHAATGLATHRSRLVKSPVGTPNE
jgi:WS/DGAT/MGAT family acyltransferase